MLAGDVTREVGRMADQTEAPNRLERRKARTRAALIKAAQGFLAVGRPTVPILEITQAADVGMGSFYNHFQTREELFETALEEALDLHGAALDALCEQLDDPAQVFAQSFRLTGRLHRRDPILSKVLLNNGLQLARSDKGLAPRARRDIEAAVRAGRFSVVDCELAMTVVSGAAICLGQLLHAQPERDDGKATDQVAADLLRMLGLSREDADKVCSRPLPALDTLAPIDTTA
jgi:AcrR family transcriptional regulator